MLNINPVELEVIRFMELEVLEKKTDFLKVAVKKETHTLLNLLRENSWKANAEQATYIVEHPYMSDPYIIVKGKDPKGILTAAAQHIVEQAKEFGKEFGKATK